VDDRLWKNVSIALGVVCAALIGIAGALMVLGNKGGSNPSEQPQSSEIANAESPSADSSLLVTASPSSDQSSESSAPPSPTQVTDASAASIQFQSLKLDAEKTSGASARTFTFTSDGAGPVKVSVNKTSAGASTRLCLKVGTGKFACKVGTLPNFLTAQADGPHDNWTVTLIGYGKTSPTVDLSITWPTVSPQMTLTHGRLQGSSTAGVAESLNGFNAVFTPRKAGVLNVQASWTSITADIDITLLDVTSNPSVTVDDRLFSSVTYINPAYTYDVDPAKTYLIKLRDKSPDSGKPDLTAQIVFP
jgi:hypothetical protein